ncbi:hypothetical protein BDV96DRAFT_594766 [Lophiotrema nucula]|uniref:Uncharacterized protein n=1 Tax=Lophiotrema nucula TaxID=690887 RepID=A0A6A5ZRI1_9PLEO|nr:hypothetical protein BDV96DRAFT_594766 [Lophiotrema nucula]
MHFVKHFLGHGYPISLLHTLIFAVKHRLWNTETGNEWKTKTSTTITDFPLPPNPEPLSTGEPSTTINTTTDVYSDKTWSPPSRDISQTVFNGSTNRSFTDYSNSSAVNGSRTSYLSITGTPGPTQSSTLSLNISTTVCPQSYPSDYEVIWKTLSDRCSEVDAQMDYGDYYSYSDTCLAAYTGPFTELGTFTLSLFREVNPTDSNGVVGPLSHETTLFLEYYTCRVPDLCSSLSTVDAFDSCGTVGSFISATTLAFDLNEISTYGTSGIQICTTMTDWLWGPWFSEGLVSTYQVDTVPIVAMTLSDLGQNCSAYYNPDDPNMYGYVGDPCHPFIAMPIRLLGLYPEWNHCYVNAYGVLYDPPKTLHPGTALVPTATPSSAIASLPPTPGQSLPQLPTATSPLHNPASSGPGSFSNIEVSLPVGPPAPVPTAILSSSNPSLQRFPAQSDRPLKTFKITVSEGVHSDLSSHIVTLFSTQVSKTKLLIVGSQIVQAGHAITIGGLTSTLGNGHKVVDHGTVLVFDPNGRFAFLGGSLTLDLVHDQPKPTGSPSAPLVLALGDRTYTENAASEIIIGSQTLKPGGTITFDGTKLYLDPKNTKVLAESSSTIALTPADKGATGDSNARLVMTLDGKLYTESGTSQLVIDGKTLSPNGVITVHGTRISLDPHATQVVIQISKAIPLMYLVDTTALSDAVITMSGGKHLTYSIDADGHLVFNGRVLDFGSVSVFGGTTLTMTDGKFTVRGGTTVSLVPAGTEMVIDGGTVAIPQSRYGDFFVPEETTSTTTSKQTPEQVPQATSSQWMSVGGESVPTALPTGSMKSGVVRREIRLVAVILGAVMVANTTLGWKYPTMIVLAGVLMKFSREASTRVSVPLLRVDPQGRVDESGHCDVTLIISTNPSCEKSSGDISFY